MGEGVPRRRYLRMNAHVSMYYARSIIARASLADIRDALRVARRCNDTATIDTLKTELARRLGA